MYDIAINCKQLFDSFAVSLSASFFSSEFVGNRRAKNALMTYLGFFMTCFLRYSWIFDNEILLKLHCHKLYDIKVLKMRRYLPKRDFKSPVEVL